MMNEKHWASDDKIILLNIYAIMQMYQILLGGDKFRPTGTGLFLAYWSVVDH